MRISFDLDDTLICRQQQVLQERRPPWFRRLFVCNEPLRQGAPDLMRELRQRGWEVWVYTSSPRSPAAVRRWLRCYGVRIDGVINQDIHSRHVRPAGKHRPPTKDPAAFGIDLHVDDSEGVRIEGERYGFRVVVVTPTDQCWAAKVRSAAAQLEIGECGCATSARLHA